MKLRQRRDAFWKQVQFTPSKHHESTAWCWCHDLFPLCLSNCSHQRGLSPHGGLFMWLLNGTGVPEGRHASHMWQIPTNCPVLWPWTSGHPLGPWVQSCWILFPWQTHSTHQTERPCSCTQTPNNRMPVLGSPFYLGKGAMWTGGQIFQGFCSGIILCDVSLKGSDGLQISGGIRWS